MSRVGAGQILALSLALLTAACGSNSATDNAASPADRLERGATLYQASCAACHGQDLRGTPRGPSHLSQVYEPGHHPDDAFRSAIQNGATAHHWNFGPMPAISGLDEEDIEAVIAYVRDVQLGEGFEPYPPG